MSKELEKIKSTNNLDVSVVIRGEKDSVFTVEAVLTQFAPREGGQGGFDIKKKANFYARGTKLEDVQNEAISKAAQLLGLGA